MECTSVPIIVILCYLAAELYKIICKGKKELNKYIPIITLFLGGILGVLIYLTSPEMIFNASNIWLAMLIGIISGSASTSTNQIIKKIIRKEENK